MELFWISLNGLDRVFLLFAVFGGLLFFVRVLLSLFGADHGDADLNAADADFDGADSHDGGGSGLPLFSLQTLTGFFVMFGLVGLALHRGSNLGQGISVLGAFIAGVATMALMAKLTQMMFGLQSSGNLNVREAVGRTAMVYLGIPAAGGIGKVQVEIGSRLVEMDAMTEDPIAIKTGERVTVVEVVNPGLLMVRRFDAQNR
jgi:hypothetical protein